MEDVDDVDGIVVEGIDDDMAVPFILATDENVTQIGPDTQFLAVRIEAT